VTEPLQLAQVSSFEHGGVTAAAAGAAGVVLADDEGSVRYVDGDGQFLLQRGAGATSVAAGDNVYTLADGTLTAFTTGGSQRWELSTLDAVGVVADPSGEGVVVRTADAELVWLRGDTGTERRRCPLPHADAPGDPKVVAADGCVAVAKFTTFTRIVDGEPGPAVQVDGAVEALGVVDGRVVAALPDGSLVGYDGGERRWTADVGARWLASVGTDRLLCDTGSGVSAVGPDGDTARVSGIEPGGRLVAAADGSVVCRIADGTASVFQPSGDAETELSLAAPVTSVDDTVSEIPLTVRNVGDTPVDTTVEIDGDGVTFAGGRVPLSLAPGGSLERVFELRRLGVGEATVTLRDGETTVDTTTLEVTEPDDTATVTGEPVSLRDGLLTVAVDIENGSGSPVEGGSVGGTRFDRVPPQTTTTVEVTVDPPAETVPVTLDGFGERSVAVDVPAEPLTLGVEATDDEYVAVTVENHVDCPATGELFVEGVPTPDGRVSRELDLPANGTLVWQLPSVASGRRSVEARTSGSHRRRRLDLGVVDAVEQAVSSGGAGAHHGTTGGDETHRDTPREPSRPESADSSGRPPVTISRSVSAEPHHAGVAITDRLAVECEDGVDRVGTLERPLSDDGTTPLPIQPRMAATRRIVAYDDERLPPLAVDVDGARYTSDEVALSVSEGPVVPYVWRTPGEESAVGVAADVEPGREVRLHAVSLASHDQPVSLDTVAESGTTTTVTRSLPACADASVVDAKLKLSVDGSERYVEMLAPRLTTDESAAGLAVEELTAGEYPTLTVVNETDESIGDVRVRCRAEGATVSTLGDGSVDEVEPGARNEFAVDFEPEPDADRVVVTVETVGADEEEPRRRDRVVGPPQGPFEVKRDDGPPEFQSVLVGEFTTD
jgi:hypothetical protein